MAVKELRVEIALGNAAMITRADLANALQTVADRLVGAIGEGGDEADESFYLVIRDENGNGCGSAEIRIIG